MASVYDSTRSGASSGVKLAALSDALVKVHKDVCGRGPTNSRCFASGNTVVCLLFGGLTAAERTLIDNGNLAEAKAHRRALHGLIEAAGRKVVEEHLGRRVTAMTMAADPANELETAVFVLDAAPEL